jgi:hypothetical protein
MEHRLKVLRRIFRPRRDYVAGWWRNIFKVELHKPYASLSIIRMINSRRMHVA